MSSYCFKNNEVRIRQRFFPNDPPCKDGIPFNDILWYELDILWYELDILWYELDIHVLFL